MLRIAICDDLDHDRAAIRREVENYLAAHRELEGTVDVFDQPAALLDALEAGATWDVAVLDVYMPGMLGTDLARELSDELPELSFVFLTTSHDHAVEAFDLGAAHYLVKPFTPEQLTAALDRALAAWCKGAGPSLALYLENGATHAVPLAEITYIESADHRQVVHTVQGPLDEHRQSLAVLYAQLQDLSPGQFITPYRGYIVNQSAIRTVTAQGITLLSGERLPLKAGEFRKTRDAYFQWLFQRGRKK